MQNENQIELLNDLIRINNDRIEGYSKAAGLLTTEREILIPVFDKLQAESQTNIQDLTNEVHRLGGSPDKGTTTGGKLYRMWMEVKATFGGDDPQSILSSCETGEDAAKEAYTNAISSAELFDSRVIVAQQRDIQQFAHDQIKTLREQYAV